MLGIETSCDETAVAIYEAGRGLLAETVYSQVPTHAPFGGVVPELASRDHIAKLAPMVVRLLADADLTLADVDGIAYTAGPGLVGALMVGGSLAGGLALGLGIPSIPVHHMEGHLLSCMLEQDTPEFPFLALLVSGGHTQLVEVRGVGRYRTVGRTLDDAAGEAFDKVARLLSLPYPGGPELARLAEHGDPRHFAFPRPLKDRGLDFSFSGLKTAVRLKLRSYDRSRQGMDDQFRAHVAASFQAAVVDTLVHKATRAMKETGLSRLVVAGGVGANQALREQLTAFVARTGGRVYYPRPTLCTDNAAMIAYTGWCRRHDVRGGEPRIVARPRWPLDELTAPS